MHDPVSHFRARLLARLMHLAAAFALAPALPIVAGCGTGEADGSSGCTTQDSPYEECFDPPDGGTCPPKEQAAAFSANPNLVSIDSDPTLKNNLCCYSATQRMTSCGVGRPFRVGGHARRAQARPGGGWSQGDAPVVDHLPARLRATLAQSWVHDGLLEHASIASFSRFALELLAVGAPAELVASAHRAALDEIRHARLCFGLAAVYGGSALAPAPFPFGSAVAVTGDLGVLAAAVVRDGCVGETLSALLASEQHAQAVDPAVRSVLAIIARDEARHAELAWRTVAWALEVGGADVEAAVDAAFSIAEQMPPELDVAATGHDEGLIEHGRLDAKRVRAVVARGMRDVVLPCAKALLRARRARLVTPLKSRHS